MEFDGQLLGSISRLYSGLYGVELWRGHGLQLWENRGLRLGVGHRFHL